MLYKSNDTTLWGNWGCTCPLWRDLSVVLICRPTSDSLPIPCVRHVLLIFAHFLHTSQRVLSGALSSLIKIIIIIKRLENVIRFIFYYPITSSIILISHPTLLLISLTLFTNSSLNFKFLPPLFNQN